MLPRSQAEAVARLLVLKKEVDVQVFDALAISLAGHDFDEKHREKDSFFGGGGSSVSLPSLQSKGSILAVFGTTSLKHSETGIKRRPVFTPRDSASAMEAGRAALPANLNGDFSKSIRRPSLEGENSVTPQYSALCIWMVEAARDLLDTSKRDQFTDFQDEDTKGGGLGFNLGRRKSDAGAVTVGELSFAVGKHASDSGEGSMISRGQGWEKYMFPGIRTQSNRERRGSVSDNSQDPWAEQDRLQDIDNRRFRYFVGTMCRARIWRYHDGALFEALKRHVQSLVDEAALSCDCRYGNICKEPGGSELIQSQWWGHNPFTSQNETQQVDKFERVYFGNSIFVRVGSAEFFRLNDATISVSTGRKDKKSFKQKRVVEQPIFGPIQRCRQDDPLIRAIRVSDVDLLEAGVPAGQLQSCQKSPEPSSEPEPHPSSRETEGTSMASRRASAAAQKGASTGQSSIIVFSTSLDRLRSVAQTDDHRDDSGIDAIAIEAAVPAPTPSLLTGITVDEEIFVQQLYRRARILSRPFQKRIFQEIRRHAAPQSFTSDWEALTANQTHTAGSTLGSNSALIIKSLPSADSSTIETATQADSQANANTFPSRNPRRKGRAARVVDCIFKGTRGCESSEQAQTAQRAYVSPVEVEFAPVKSLARMRDKVRLQLVTSSLLPLNGSQFRSRSMRRLMPLGRSVPTFSTLFDAR